MKKTLIALMALAGVASAADVLSNNVTIGNSQKDGITMVVQSSAGLDIDYSKYPNTIISTIDDKVQAWAVYYKNDTIGTENASLTLNIKNQLVLGGQHVLGSDDTYRLYVNTELTDTELSTLDTANRVSRWVVTCDNGIRNFDADKITLTLQGFEDYAVGGHIVDYNGTFYDASAITFESSNGNAAYYRLDTSEANKIELAANTIYTTYKMTGTSGATIKGIGFLVVPEPATATLSLLALAGLCARRRRG